MLKFRNSKSKVDGMQKALDSQMELLLTRIGEGSKLVGAGDLAQHDRGYESNGLKMFIERLERLGATRIRCVMFGDSDIERHPVVEEVLKLYDMPM